MNAPIREIRPDDDPITAELVVYAPSQIARDAPELLRPRPREVVLGRTAGDFLTDIFKHPGDTREDAYPEAPQFVREAR